jgi:hypothetical protein
MLDELPLGDSHGREVDLVGIGDAYLTAVDLDLDRWRGHGRHAIRSDRRLRD